MSGLVTWAAGSPLMDDSAHRANYTVSLGFLTSDSGSGHWPGTLRTKLPQLLPQCHVLPNTTGVCPFVRKRGRLLQVSGPVVSLSKAR